MVKPKPIKLMKKGPKVPNPKVPNLKGQNPKVPTQKVTKKAKETKENANNVLVVGDSKEKLDKSEVSLAVSMLLKVAEERRKKSEKKDLFEDVDGERINLQIAGIKLPKDNRQQLLRVKLPHKTTGDPNVCLFVKDLEKGIRVDHEPTLIHFQDMLKDKDVDSLITQVIALRELKVEYKPFETKTALCHKFDVFLADDRIIRFLPQYLGKPFIKRKKFPVQVNLEAKDLRKELESALRTSILPLNHHGTCSMLQVGSTTMKPEDIADNIIAATEVLSKRYPGGWKNIRSIHVKTETSLAIPLHISSRAPNEIGFVDADVPARIKKQPVTDELSTIPGAIVTVFPFGGVKVVREKDPNWDDEHDEPFVSGSEEEDEEENEEKDEQQKKEKSNPKKRGRDDEDEKSKKEKKKVPSKKSKQEESDDSGDEMEAAELKYMKKVADEEEEMERNDPNHKPEKEPEEKEKEDDDESNMSTEEQEPVYDDAQELGEEDVVTDDECEEEDESDDEALILKNKPTNYNSDDEEAGKEEHKKPLKRKSKGTKRKELKAKKEKEKSSSKKKNFVTPKKVVGQKSKKKMIKK